MSIKCACVLTSGRVSVIHIRCVRAHFFCTCVCPGGARGVARGWVMKRNRDPVFGVSMRQNEVG